MKDYDLYVEVIDQSNTGENSYYFTGSFPAERVAMISEGEGMSILSRDFAKMKNGGEPHTHNVYLFVGSIKRIFHAFEGGGEIKVTGYGTILKEGE